MLPVEILAYIFSLHKALWKSGGLTHNRLIEILGLKCSPARISEALKNPARASIEICVALGEPDVQREISELLRAPGLFCVANVNELDALLAKHCAVSEEKETPQIQIFHSDQLFEGWDELALSQSETNVLNALRDAINTADERLIEWGSNRFTGANFISSLIRPQELQRGYDAVAFLSPSSTGSDAFKPEIKALGKVLGLSFHQIIDGRSLSLHLRKKNILLVVKHAEYLPPVHYKQGEHPLVNLVRECGTRSEQSPVPQVLLVGKLKQTGTQLNADQFAENCPNVALSRAAAYKLFKSQLQRFYQMRGYPRTYDEGGFRPKRARWLFEGEKPRSGAFNPMDIRVRAFFASDPQNYGYYDCTQGFKRLAGEFYDKLPVDVAEYLHAGQLYIDSISGRKRRSPLQVLRWVSTGIYWVSDPAMNLLRKNSLGIKRTTTVTDEGFWSAVSTLSDVVRKVRLVADIDGEQFTAPNSDEGGDPNLLFVSPFALKAIVQDHWKENDSYERSAAHFKVAERLHANQHNKSALHYELPYEPHWGRTRHYFLAETIRHLVRASEGVRASKPSVDYDPKEFPARPVQEGRNGTTNPIHTLHYCYSVLYSAQLNSNSGAHRARKLSTRHGAYHMTAEILQHFSQSNSLDQPNEFLPEKFRRSFYDDVGFAQLDLGEIAEAKTSFEKSLNCAVQEIDRAGQFKALMDLALACTIMGREQDLQDAMSYIDRARMHPETQLKPLGEAEANIRKNQDRVSAREAHVNYLQGNIHLAKQLYMKLEAGSLKKDTAHAFIAVLMREADHLQKKLESDNDLLEMDKKKIEQEIARNHEQSMKICTQNIFTNTSSARHHEALGFRVALSHILRKLGMIDASQASLELIRTDILNFGCSERVYQSFLLESGRNLLEQNLREVRAYAVYLRPCFQRAIEKRSYRVAKQSKKFCIDALDRIETALRAEKTIKLETHVDGSSKTSGKFNNPSVPQRGQYFLDPLASYQDTEVSEELSTRLSSLVGVREEREWLNGFELG